MDPNKPTYRLIDHTADLGIMVHGANLKDLFEQAAISMMHIIVGVRSYKGPNTIRLSVSGEDLADLMIRWLGEILYIFEGEKQIVTKVGIDAISPHHITATLETVSFDQNLHEILCEIKAVTYHQIEVMEKADHWEARIIFDL